jgi:arsenite methyltransferase
LLAGRDQSVPIERDPRLNFDERDLLRWARDAGFAELELDYRAEVGVPERPPTADWDVLKATAPNSLAPSLEEALDQTLTDEERRRFERHARAALAAGTPARTTTARTFLRGVRP